LTNQAIQTHNLSKKINTEVFVFFFSKKGVTLLSLVFADNNRASILK